MSENTQFQALRADYEKLRQALEIIAVGDSPEPQLTAKNVLVEIGFWRDESVKMEQPHG